LYIDDIMFKICDRFGSKLFHMYIFIIKNKVYYNVIYIYKWTQKKALIMK
jgi:hypothetical protein